MTAGLQIITLREKLYSGAPVGWRPASLINFVRPPRRDPGDSKQLLDRDGRRAFDERVLSCPVISEDADFHCVDAWLRRRPAVCVRLRLPSVDTLTRSELLIGSRAGSVLNWVFPRFEKLSKNYLGLLSFVSALIWLR